MANVGTVFSLSGKASRVDWWQIVADTLPMVAAIMGIEKIAAGTAEDQLVAVKVERVPKDDVVTVFLG